VVTFNSFSLVEIIHLFKKKIVKETKNGVSTTYKACSDACAIGYVTQNGTTTQMGCCQTDLCNTDKSLSNQTSGSAGLSQIFCTQFAIIALSLLIFLF
jgi:hypothetical protein